jgi:hypothetical protein
MTAAARLQRHDCSDITAAASAKRRDSSCALSGCGSGCGSDGSDSSGGYTDPYSSLRRAVEAHQGAGAAPLWAELRGHF